MNSTSIHFPTWYTYFSISSKLNFLPNFLVGTRSGIFLLKKNNITNIILFSRFPSIPCVSRVSLIPLLCCHTERGDSLQKLTIRNLTIQPSHFHPHLPLLDHDQPPKSPIFLLDIISHKPLYINTFHPLSHLLFYIIKPSPIPYFPLQNPHLNTNFTPIIPSNHSTYIIPFPTLKPFKFKRFFAFNYPFSDHLNRYYIL